jgi:hypothetical protein
MEGLKLIGEHPKEQLHIYEEGVWIEGFCQWVHIFEADGDEAFYHLNKAEAKQIVEHLTKVFEL